MHKLEDHNSAEHEPVLQARAQEEEGGGRERGIRRRGSAVEV
jgi:hypothetical protein